MKITDRMMHMTLTEFFKNHPRIAVAFSGGVDSSYLLYAAMAAGCEVKAYFVNSGFQPEFERLCAAELAKLLGVPLEIIETDALSEPDVAANPADRCYHCKRAVFTLLWDRARQDGFDTLCDGTNADDIEADRPGMRALRELGVLSPLRDCGLTKSEIRRLSKEAVLETHDKPAYACLATRVPFGTAITTDLLDRIERAEDALFNLGFTDFRARYLPPNAVKLQFPSSQLAAAIEKREDVLSALTPEFDDVLLDLKPR